MSIYLKNKKVNTINITLSPLLFMSIVCFMFLNDKSEAQDYPKFNDNPVVFSIPTTTNSTNTNSINIYKTPTSSLSSYLSFTNSDLNSTSSTTSLKYVEIINACNYNFAGSCLAVRSGPGTQFPKVSRLRNGTVLKISEIITTNTATWYKINFVSEKIKDKTKTETDWYIRSDYTRPVYDVAADVHNSSSPEVTNKKIVVDTKLQKLYAYENDIQFLETKISSGNIKTPTKLGNFYIFYKTPSRYMQGTSTDPTDPGYDLPGVPWDMYFNSDGSAIHGAYWHNSFGRRHSHGCVNMKIDEAEALYRWAPVGTKVIVK